MRFVDQSNQIFKEPSKKIVKEQLLHATEGAVLDPDDDESVFFTQKVLNKLNLEWNIEQKCVKSQNKYNEKKFGALIFLILVNVKIFDSMNYSNVESYYNMTLCRNVTGVHIQTYCEVVLQGF